MIMIGKCSGPNSSELGMVLVLPLIGWSVCDLLPGLAPFTKWVTPEMTPAAFWPSIHDSAFSLRASTDKPKEERNRHSSWCQSGGLLYFVLLCYAFFTLHNDCFWFLVVVFFFPRTALFFSIWLHIVGSYKAPGKETVVNSSTWKSVCLILYIWGLLKFSALCGGPFYIWTGTQNQLQSRQDGRREWPHSAKMCIVQ